MRTISLTDKFFELEEGVKIRLLLVFEHIMDSAINIHLFNSIIDDSPIFCNTNYFEESKDIVKVNVPLLKAHFGISVKVKEIKEPEKLRDFDKAVKLLTAYNDVRTLLYIKQGKNYVTRVELTPALYKDINNLICFLESNKVEDWYLFFYCLCVSCQWKFMWMLRSCTNAKAYDIYNDRQKQCRIEIEAQKNQSIQPPPKDRWVDIFDHLEERKKKYISAGQEEVCMNNMDQMLGYHPMSQYCNSCRLKEMCKEKIRNEYFMATKSSLDILEIRGKMKK